MKFPTVYAYGCSVKWSGGVTVINHVSAGKARYAYLRELRDAVPDATFADVVVRKLGAPVNTEACRRTAEYRRRPELRCGVRVLVRVAGETESHWPGVIVDGNYSANFDVLFGDGPAAGAVLNVHPGEISLAREDVATAVPA